mmetsp:Transcript_36977/g.98520  ORF Transcript_36977/g.98520 Transcript_36977/m.98520 type:complete len:242 (-) Transcript_36977:242-967(-)
MKRSGPSSLGMATRYEPFSASTEASRAEGAKNCRHKALLREPLVAFQEVAVDRISAAISHDLPTTSTGRSKWSFSKNEALVKRPRTGTTSNRMIPRPSLLRPSWILSKEAPSGAGATSLSVVGSQGFLLPVDVAARAAASFLTFMAGAGARLEAVTLGEALALAFVAGFGAGACLEPAFGFAAGLEGSLLVTAAGRFRVEAAAGRFKSPEPSFLTFGGAAGRLGGSCFVFAAGPPDLLGRV